MAKRNNPDRERVCLSTLKSRGWTEQLIDQYLPEPMLVPNPNYRSSAAMRLWYLDEVEMVENSTEAFQKRLEKRAKKREEKEQRRLEAQRQKEERITKLSNEMNVRNPAKDYPNARKMARHFILNVGPTNTGKTYRALQALKEAESGVYLGPLRLLAMEVQDKLLTEGIACSMLTGEEEDIVDGATIMSSTVEKIDLHQEYDVGVIDECQMISDDERGGSWTRAILGLAAETIYLCMSPDAKSICIKLIELCGDTYEVVECTRNTPLFFRDHIEKKDIQKNDAVVVFSRRRVLELAEELKLNHGLTPSVVYGALPYKARKQQVDLYLSGQTDVIVATDAIGMGMNLPIKRIVFSQGEKFDGVCVRPLSISEVQQISGRAGRYGMFEEGQVVTLTQNAMIKERFNGLSPTIQKAHIPFPEEALRHNDAPLSEVINDWARIQYPSMFTQQNMALVLDRVVYLEKTYKNMPRETNLRLAMVVFDEKDETLRDLWEKYVDCFVNGIKIKMPVPNEICRTLQVNERSYKELELFYSFCKSMHIDFNYDELMKRKEHIIDLINECLMETNRKANKKKDKKKKRRKKVRNEMPDDEWNDYLDKITSLEPW